MLTVVHDPYHLHWKEKDHVQHLAYSTSPPERVDWGRVDLICLLVQPAVWQCSVLKLDSKLHTRCEENTYC